MNRRTFLTSSSLLLTTPILGGVLGCSEKVLANTNTIVGGYSFTDDQGVRLDQHGVIAFNANNDHYDVLSDFKVPSEVHLASLFPNQKYILVCSRKPRASLLKYDLKGHLVAELPPLENQHFEGHGIFSVDEQYIYATASDYVKGEGRLLKINSEDLSLVSDVSSGGIGPHELVWQSDQDIAIANTGVLTHPDRGRKALNLSTMQSTVVLFNTQKGIITDTWPVKNQGLSARHLDRMANGDLVIGCQYQKEDKRPACVALAGKGKALVFAETNNELLHWNMKGYTASIKAIPNSSKAMITNPRGQLLTQWRFNQQTSTATAALQKQTEIDFNKGLKIADDGKTAWLTVGAGKVQQIHLNDPFTLYKSPITIKENIWWGNHLGA